MGEEYGETNPFLFFTDFHGDLAKAVRDGRAREFEGHAGHQGESVPDPNAKKTFANSKLDWQKPKSRDGIDWLSFTKKLLALRQQHVVPLLATAGGKSGKVLETDKGFLAVSWTFPKGRLSLALNIGGKSHAVLDARGLDATGEVIFAWPDKTTDLQQNSIVVRLEAAGSAA